MTCYAYDDTRHALVATWGTGAGDVAITVVDLPHSSTTEQAMWLAQALTRLSEAAWRCYTHPASAEETVKPNSEGWRRQDDRERFSEVVPALTAPHLPESSGLIREYSPVLEPAHAVGRVLHALGHADVTARVVADVQLELDVIERAERGDLSGRARQAVLLTREDASPIQVVAADERFDREPLGPELFRDLKPTAVAVAAAHWLHAAATVVARQSGIPVTSVVFEADNIEALPTLTPTRVLELMGTGLTPRKAVTHLIQEAMHTAEGVILNPEAVKVEIRKVEKLRRRFGVTDEDIRITPLDPMRPAPDLLEDLLAGIYGCWLLYRSSAYGGDADTSDGEDEDSSDVEDEDDARDRERVVLTRFEEEVRAEARAQRDRLL